MKRSDIDDAHVVELARAWRKSARSAGMFATAPGVVEALVAEGVPEKLAVSKVLHLSMRGLLDYGTSPYHAWPAHD